MSIGTIKLTNNSNQLVGTGTKFLTDLNRYDIVFTTIGAVPYNLAVASIESDTAATLIAAHTGASVNGNGWTAVPFQSMVAITNQLHASISLALRGANNNAINWQQLLTAPGDVTITTINGQQFSGAGWQKITKLVNDADLGAFTQLASQVSQNTTAAQTAKTAAEAAQNNAITAKNDAVTAKNQSVQSASESNNSAALALASQVSAGNSAQTASTQADRAKTEADKLANNNALAGAIDSVDTTTNKVTFKGPVAVTTFSASGNATFGTRIDVTDIVAAARMSTTGNATFNGITTVANLVVNGPLRTAGFRVEQGKVGPDQQGLAIIWNETPSDAAKSGAVTFANNKGNGAGGFVWRNVNAANTIQDSAMWFRPDGRLTIERNAGGPVQQMILGAAGHGVEFITNVTNNGTTKYIELAIDGAGKGINFFDSDATLKHEIVDAARGASLTQLDQIRPRSFRWNDNNQLQQFGVIAQELEEVFPEAVITPKNTDGSDSTKSLNPSVLISYLLCVVKDLKAEIDDLKAK